MAGRSSSQRVGWSLVGGGVAILAFMLTRQQLNAPSVDASRPQTSSARGTARSDGADGRAARRALDSTRVSAAAHRMSGGARVDPRAAADKRERILAEHPDWGAEERELNAPKPVPSEQIDPQWIRSRIRDDFVPILIECYNSELAENPKLAGDVALSFRLVLDPEIGTVVESAAIVPETTTLQSPALHECMVESVLSLDFDLPIDEGFVDVTYPFTFEPDDEHPPDDPAPEDPAPSEAGPNEPGPARSAPAPKDPAN